MEKECNMKKINDHFSVTKGSRYELITDRTCRLKSAGKIKAMTSVAHASAMVPNSVAEAWAEGAIAAAFHKGAKAKAMVGYSLAESWEYGSRAEAYAKDSYAEAYVYGAIARAEVEGSYSVARSRGARAQAWCQGSTAKAQVPGSVAEAWGFGSLAKALCKEAIARGRPDNVSKIQLNAKGAISQPLHSEKQTVVNSPIIHKINNLYHDLQKITAYIFKWASKKCTQIYRKIPRTIKGR